MYSAGMVDSLPGQHVLTSSSYKSVVGCFSKTHAAFGKPVISLQRTLTWEHYLQQGFGIGFWEHSFSDSKDDGISALNCSLTRARSGWKFRSQSCFFVLENYCPSQLDFKTPRSPRHRPPSAVLNACFFTHLVTHHPRQLRHCTNDRIPVYFCKCFGIRTAYTFY